MELTGFTPASQQLHPVQGSLLTDVNWLVLSVRFVQLMQSTGVVYFFPKEVALQQPIEPAPQGAVPEIVYVFLFLIILIFFIALLPRLQRHHRGSLQAPTPELK